LPKYNPLQRIMNSNALGGPEISGTCIGLSLSLNPSRSVTNSAMCKWNKSFSCGHKHERIKCTEKGTTHCSGTHLWSKIGHRDCSKYNACKYVVWRRLSLYVCWHQTLVICKVDITLLNFGLPQNSYPCTLTSVLLGNKIAESNALAMPEGNFIHIHITWTQLTWE
jgi:hypothetical protein